MLKKIVSIVMPVFLCFQSSSAAEFYSDGEDKDYSPIFERYHINQGSYDYNGYKGRHTRQENKPYVPCHVHPVLEKNLEPVEIKSNVYDKFTPIKESLLFKAEEILFELQKREIYTYYRQQICINQQFMEPIEVSDSYLQKYEKKNFTTSTIVLPSYGK